MNPGKFPHAIPRVFKDKSDIPLLKFLGRFIPAKTQYGPGPAGSEAEEGGKKKGKEKPGEKPAKPAGSNFWGES
jgi:hypothetical protein